MCRHDRSPVLHPESLYRVGYSLLDRTVWPHVLDMYKSRSPGRTGGCRTPNARAPSRLPRHPMPLITRRVCEAKQLPGAMRHRSKRQVTAGRNDVLTIDIRPACAVLRPVRLRKPCCALLGSSPLTELVALRTPRHGRAAPSLSPAPSSGSTTTASTRRIAIATSSTHYGASPTACVWHGCDSVPCSEPMRPIDEHLVP